MEPKGNGDLEAEAIRLYRRYQREIVEAFGFCPWAMVAREQGHVKERVVFPPAHDGALAAIDALAADEEVEIGLLLFPCFEIDRPGFERFVAEVRERHADRHRPEPSPFAMAEFHPDAPAVVSPAGAFTSFIRRTPDPTIQLVRQSVLARVRKADKQHGTGFFDMSRIRSIEDLERSLGEPEGPPIHERVLAQNRETVLREGLRLVEERMESIRRDRVQTYARLRDTPGKEC